MSHPRSWHSGQLSPADVPYLHTDLPRPLFLGTRGAGLIGLLFLLLVSLVPVTSWASPTALVGAWDCQVSFAGMTGEGDAVVFDNAGTVTVAGQPFAYAVLPGNLLRMSAAGEASDYRYDLSGDTLVMRYADGSAFDCRRSQRPAPHAGAGRQEAAMGQGGDSNWQLQGAFCHWSGSSSSSSSYSSTRRLSFDGQGRWVYGAESSFSGNAGLAYGGQGNQDSGTYRIVGDQIHYSTASGERGVAQVKIRQNSGRITEIVVDGELYAVQLCQ